MASRCGTIISMQSIARMGLLVAVLSTASDVSARAPYTIPTARPASIREVKEVLRGGGARQSVTDYLEEAMCGGWDKEIDVGKIDNFNNAEERAVSGFMSRVVGVPGRQHWWSGDIRSGVGIRYDSDDLGDSKDDEYEYPDTTKGFTTACAQNTRFVERMTWDRMNPVVGINNDGDLFSVFPFEQRRHIYEHPFFNDPTCRWRREGGVPPPLPLIPDDPNIPNYDQESVEFEEPPSCAGFCQYLNTYVYRDCVLPRTFTFDEFLGLDGNNNPVTVLRSVTVCDREGLRYVCTQEEVTNEEERLRACEAPHPDLEEWANARLCTGQQCRCPEPNPLDPDQCIRVRDEEKGKPEAIEYKSFYRNYSGVSYFRSKLDKHVPDDNETKSMEVACFGFYNEFDPKFKRTENADRRCVINVNVEGMRETQKGKGEYKESDVKDKDPTENRHQRPGGTKKEPTDPGAYDVENDTWYKKLGGAFSFINEKLFEADYQRDLSNVYLDYDSLDDGKHNATAQISDEDPVTLFAESNLMRAFDDTGNQRAYARWWQEQQIRMAAIMRAPTLRIVLPNAWFMGLDPDDPFLRVQQSDPAAERANRSDRIELQIEADEDVLGTALAYIERSVLLHVEEEPIPVIVPMGSPAEFRARAADWCAWYRTTNGEKTCDNAPEDVKNVMDQLEEYAQRIDDVRELRAELSNAASEILELQSELLKPIATWFKDNEVTLMALISGRERVERELLPIWRLAQASVAEMHERSNLPWCMNQRFTAPILSMGVQIDEKELPELPIIPRPEDVIIDFSAVAAMSGTIKIPVLKPIQIRIDIPTPPTPGPLAELPDIHAIRNAMNDVLKQLPRVDDRLGQTPIQQPPAPLSNEFLTQSRISLVLTESIVKGMNERYKKYWRSIGPLTPLDPAQPDFEEARREKELKELLRCKEWDTNQCQHVEMDLWERIQRIGSRPLVQLKQDFLSVGTPRSEATVCLPEDDACHILNAERTDPGFRWEVRGSRANDAPIEELKMTIITLTQPPPLGTVDPQLLEPYDDEPAPLQSFPKINLLP